MLYSIRSCRIYADERNGFKTNQRLNRLISKRSDNNMGSSKSSLKLKNWSDAKKILRMVKGSLISLLNNKIAQKPSSC